MVPPHRNQYRTFGISRITSHRATPRFFLIPLTFFVFNIINHQPTMKFVAAAIAVPALLAINASANCADDIISDMMGSFQPEQAKNFAANVLFEIEGDETGPGCVFNVDVRDGMAEGRQGGRRRNLKGKGKGNGEAIESDELDFQFNAKTFEAINSGKVSGLMAWVMGDLKVKG